MQMQYTPNLLKIETYCAENKMQNILSSIEEHIFNNVPYDISDIDSDIYDVRLCVKFDCWQDNLRVISAELYQEYTGFLYEDTAVLNSRLRTIIEEYNRQHRNLIA